MYTEGHEGRSRGIAAITKDAVSADRRVGVSASLQPRRSESRRTFFWTCHAGSRRSASLPRPMSGRAM
jgi:hypothetical protein